MSKKLTDDQKAEFSKLVDHYLVQHVQIIDLDDGRVQWGLMNITNTFAGGYDLAEPTMLTEMIFENSQKAVNHARETLRKRPSFLNEAKSCARQDMAYNKKM